MEKRKIALIIFFASGVLLIFAGFILTVNWSLASLTRARDENTCQLLIMQAVSVNESYPPLIFHENGTLVSKIRSGKLLILRKGDRVVLSCREDNSAVRAKCVSRNTLKINATTVDYNPDLFCANPQMLAVTNRDVPFCRQTAIQFTYLNPITNEYNISAEACYRWRSHGNSEYGKQLEFIHVALGQDLGQLRVPNNLHDNGSQNDSFLNYEPWEEELPDERYFRESSYIDSGFAPNEQLHIDRGFNTYFSYRMVKNNLNSLKSDVNRLDKSRKIDLYVGPHEMRTVTVGETIDSIQVPRYIWVMLRSNNGQAVVFIQLNDPLISKEELEKIRFCRNKCNEIEWLYHLTRRNAFEKISKGYIWCCEYDEIRDRIVEIPQMDTVNGLLVE